MQIKTASDWAIDNGYINIETDTSDEFVAWQEFGPLTVLRKRYTNDFVALKTGVKAWRDEYRNCFVAVRRYDNGEQLGEQRGFGETMLEALKDL